VTEVAHVTLRCLLRHVPAAVPGVVFLSGGQRDVMATAHLNKINARACTTPRKLTFSYGRALQDLALATWLGNKDNAQPAQRAYYHRARCNSAATLGQYTAIMENEFTGKTAKEHRSDSEDD
jgi:fructose-bisphosphate aldolase, class I